MSSPLGSDDYREGALARLEDARRLRDQERWVGAIYMAGRAVETLLRSLLWLNRREQEVSHDLRRLLRRAQSLGLLGEDETRLRVHINEVAILWQNNLRFMGDNRFARVLKETRRDKRVGGRPVLGDALKANANYLLELCEEIVDRGEVVWKRYRRRSKES